MADGPFLADSSVWLAAWRHAAVRPAHAELVQAGALLVCPPVVLELAIGARNARELGMLRAGFAALRSIQVTGEVVGRALDVIALLAEPDARRRGQPGWVDALTAACAETAGVPLLHYDAHFDLIASLTGQETRWLAPRGSL